MSRANEAPHASRAGRHSDAYIYIYIYVTGMPRFDSILIPIQAIPANSNSRSARFQRFGQYGRFRFQRFGFNDSDDSDSCDSVDPKQFQLLRFNRFGRFPPKRFLRFGRFQTIPIPPVLSISTGFGICASLLQKCWPCMGYFMA